MEGVLNFKKKFKNSRQLNPCLISPQKSSLSENWQSACGKSVGSVVGGGSEGGNHRYIVYRQPISLDRFFIHDIAEGESNLAKLDYAFVIVSLNRFQQIVAVHTLQAPSEQVKVRERERKRQRKVIKRKR